ncbi:hypothetical protein MUP77_14215 [Candidatus Bathyarchaeota archaeon]|nr:hypothetical protein [Candidatus Bathyarchaeota archaeon]
MGYKTNLLKYGAVLKMLDFIRKDSKRKMSIIKKSLNISNDELNETLSFLQCIGAVRKENKRLQVTNYGIEVLSKIESNQGNQKKLDE